MIALPGDLAAWGGLLGLFPPDLAGELGRMLPRLALAVGPMRASQPTGGGEPDGFAGIARRGSYERLLHTEWLLADEAPDEFARRASAGEHAFFQIDRRSPARVARSMAVFDAGPGQLGAPRIAQLAALIVLAQRAERAGAEFVWGVLGEPDAGVRSVVTAPSVLLLLGARSAVAATEGDVAAWAERADRLGCEDAWIVGDRPPGGAWARATLEIRDVLDPERRALALTARAPRAPPREVEIDLPEPPACVRLLRDPLSAVAPAPRRFPGGHGPTSNLVFALNGTKLFARNAGGEIVAYPIPNSPRDTVGQPKRYRARTDGLVAAVGWVKRALAMLTLTPDAIVLEQTGAGGPGMLRRRVAHAGVALPGPLGWLSPLIYRDATAPEVIFLDGRRALYRIVRDYASDAAGSSDDMFGRTRVERLATEVSALAASPTSLTFVGRDTEGEAAQRRDTPLIGVQTLKPGAPPDLDAHWHLVTLTTDSLPSTKEAILGDGSFQACVGFGFAAVQRRGDTWTIHDGSAPTEVTLPAGARVVGFRADNAAREVKLMLLEGDQRTLALTGRASRHALPRASAPIAHVTTNPWRTQLAYVTTAGEVVVHSLYADAPLARFVPEG